MRRLDLSGSSDLVFSKPEDAVLGVHLSVSEAPSVSYGILERMPSLSAIRKDNYQGWLYADGYPDMSACSKLQEALQTTDLSGNPNCYSGFKCDTAAVMGNHDYFWQDEVDRCNVVMQRETGNPLFTLESIGTISTDILVPVDFIVVSFGLLIKKHTILRAGKEILTVSMGKRRWTESTLPTLLLQFQGDDCTVVEVCNALKEIEGVDFLLDTELPIRFNNVPSSIR